jgi:hypothetical protein
VEAAGRDIIAYVCGEMNAMKKELLTLFFALSALTGFGQVTFHMIYGTNQTNRAYCLQQTTDGGYIISGSSIIGGNINQVVYLVKTNSAGSFLWTRTYGLDTTFSYGYSVRQTTDGGYIVAGSTRFDSTYDQVYLIKTDSTGDTLWTKTYGDSNWGSEVAYSVEQTTDGGYVTAGSSTAFWGVYVIKTNSIGDTLWTKIFRRTSNDIGYSIRQTSDNGYIIAGSTWMGVGNTDAYLIKIDSAGSSLWAKTFGGVSDERGYDVKQTTDGGYIIAGYTASFGAGNGDALLIKTNNSGTIQWTKTYGGISGDEADAVQQTADGGYVIAGSTAAYLYLIKTNGTGDTTWTKRYGNPYCFSANSVQQTTDGGYIIGGFTDGLTPDNGHVYLVKTDSLGNTACYQFTTTTSVAVPALITTSPATTVTIPPTIVATPYIYVNGLCCPNIICVTTGLQSAINNPQSAIDIYPNPFTGLFHISVNHAYGLAGTEAAIVKTEVYNCIGEKVWERGFENHSLRSASVTSTVAEVLKATSVVDLTKAAAGIYFYSVALKDGTVARGKIIKEN